MSVIANRLKEPIKV